MIISEPISTSLCHKTGYLCVYITCLFVFEKKTVFLMKNNMFKSCISIIIKQVFW